MIFIDSHAHINDPAFDGDRAEVLQKAFSVGLSHIVEIGCEAGEWQPALALCAAYSGKTACALGMHPIMAKDFKESDLPVLKAALQNQPARAVGEIGLDYNYLDSTPKDTQNKVFETMLDLAKAVSKPVVLHCRKSPAEGDFSAYEDMFNALKRTGAVGGVMHCFSGRYEDAVRALDMGFLLGVTGIVGYKKNNDLRETFKKTGIKYLIIETDCPYLPPQSKRGKRNEPSLIPEIASDLSVALGEPLSKVADITSQNTTNLFKL
jgi:TatD DNase family protein